MKHVSARTRTLLSITSALLAVVIGSGLALAMNNGVQKLPIKQYFNTSYTNAVWDWSNIHNHTRSELQETADFLYTHQINTVYVDITRYGDIVRLKNDGERQQLRDQYTKSVEQYVEAMASHNIKVLAAAGNTEWSKPEHQAKPLAVQQFVFDYNRTHEHKLTGIEYDIESYNQEHFEGASFTEKELVLLEFMDLLDKLVVEQSAYNKKHDQQLELGFAIPYWYDNQNHNIRSITWKDKTGPVLYHALDRLNELTKSNVVVMAYRNAALGNDGMIYHSRTEVEYADSKAPNVEVIIGMEVNEVEPEKITFYGRTYTEISSEAKLVHGELQNKQSFRGIAINDLAGYRELEQFSGN